jgi:hypothetical protein
MWRFKAAAAAVTALAADLRPDQQALFMAAIAMAEKKIQRADARKATIAAISASGL